MFKKIFGQTNPEEEVKKWVRSLRSEQRKIDLQISKIRREEQKVKVSMKQAAKKNDTVAVRMLAKELIRSRKAVNRLYTAKTQMNSVGMQLQNQVTQAKIAGHLEKSGEIMREMNKLINVKEVQQSMMAMSKEMAKTGLIEELMNDAIDDTLDEDISDSELEGEVNKIVEEVTQQQMQGARVGASSIPVVQQQQQEIEEEEEDDELMAKFNALKAS